MEPFENIRTHWQDPNTWWQFAIDVILASFVLYALLVFLKKHGLLRLLLYALPFAITAAVIYAYRKYLPLSGALVALCIGSIVVIFAVSFTNEFRRGLFRLASPRREADHYNTGYSCSDEELGECVTELVKGMTTLAKNNVGALIILQKGTMPSHVIDSGTKLGAVVTAPLLESIFNTKAPLHDGAVVVEGNRIVAAGCFLPLSQSLSLPKELGTRHRAGIGITENADVVSLIVSEETGVISVAKNGVITRYYDAKMLTQEIERFFGLKASDSPRKRH